MKIAVGISGGVDSAVAALLCKEQGHEVIGVMMKIWDERFADHKCDPERDACFGPEETCIEDASKICDQIGIPLHLIDCSTQFQSEIISYFSDSYLSGITPNPCVYCNQKLKFGLLPKLLFDNVSDIDKFATGHYAQLIHDQSGQPHLHRGADLQKDQSYFLHRLTREQLSMACFPIGHLTKSRFGRLLTKLKFMSGTNTRARIFTQEIIVLSSIPSLAVCATEISSIPQVERSVFITESGIIQLDSAKALVCLQKSLFTLSKSIRLIMRLSWETVASCRQAK